MKCVCTKRCFAIVIDHRPFTKTVTRLTQSPLCDVAVQNNTFLYENFSAQYLVEVMFRMIHEMHTKENVQEVPHSQIDYR